MSDCWEKERQEAKLMIEVMLPQGHQLSHLGTLGYVYPPRKQELVHVGLKCPVHQATSQCWMYQHVFTFLFHSVFLRNLYYTDLYPEFTAQVGLA